MSQQCWSSRNAGGQLYSELPTICAREVEGESITMRKQRKGSATGPTASQTNQPGSALKYIPGCIRGFEEVLRLVEDYFKLDCTACIAMAYPPNPGRFCVVTLMVDGKGKAKEYTLDCVGKKLLLDQNTLGDILTNLAFGGADAVDLYISSRGGVGRKLSLSKPKEVLTVIRPLFGTQ